MHVVKRYPDAPGGDAYVVRGLEREQLAAGHHVVVVTSRNALIRDASHVIKFGLPLTDEAIDAINLRRILTMIALTVRAFPLLRWTRPDVIHVHTTDLGWSLRLAARRYRIPCVITLHGTTIGKRSTPMPKRLLEGALLRSGGYSRIITMDPSTMPALSRLGVGDRLDYIPNGIDPADVVTVPEDAGPPPAAAPPTVLFAGRLEAVKGVDVLLIAFAAVLRDHPTARLLLAGSGSRRAELETATAELGITGSVRFVGVQARDELSALYRAATLFVLPSLHEGFPMVLLEAWAHGTPVVTTSVGAVPDVCVSGVDTMVVPPGEADDLAAAIGRLLGDSELAARIGAGGRRRLASGEFTPGAVAGRVQGVYDEVVATGDGILPGRRRLPWKASRNAV